MHRLPRNTAATAAALLVLVYAAWAPLLAQSGKGSGAQKKQGAAKDQKAAEEHNADQKPAETPAAAPEQKPGGGLFKNKVLGESSSAQRTKTASAGFNGVDPSGKVATALLTATPTAEDKQKALVLSTLAMPDDAILKFIQEGNLPPPPAKVAPAAAPAEPPPAAAPEKSDKKDKKKKGGN
jgi:hypothetical protein